MENHIHFQEPVLSASDDALNTTVMRVQALPLRLGAPQDMYFDERALFFDSPLPGTTVHCGKRVLQWQM